MVIRSTGQCYSVWLQPGELSDNIAVLQIERLKKEKKTFVFVAGDNDMLGVLKKLMIKNAERIYR